MTELVPFAQAPVPAYFSSLPPDQVNIGPKDSVPALSFRGKTWRMVVDGEEKVIMNSSGEAVTSVDVVLLDYIKRRSRVFYAGQYVAGENKKPDCSSLDGERPDADIENPVCPTCAACPNAVKGSKISANGKATTACGVTKRIAVVPSGTMASANPLLLRLPATSIWDKQNQENEAKGFYAWEQYIDMLRQRGCQNVAQVVTRIRFDHRTEYPKLLFAAVRWLSPDEWQGMTGKWNSQEVRDLLLGKGAGDGIDNDDAVPGIAQAPVAQAPVAQAPVAQAPAAQAPAATAPAAAPRRRAAAAPAAAAAPVQTAAPAPAQAAAPAAGLAAGWGDDDDGMQVAAAPAAQPAATAPVQQAAPATAPAAAPAAVNAGVDALLSGWDD